MTAVTGGNVVSSETGSAGAPDERRRHPRVWVASELSIVNHGVRRGDRDGVGAVVHPGGNGEVPALIQNVSLGGARLITPEETGAAGDSLLLLFPIGRRQR